MLGVPTPVLAGYLLMYVLMIGGLEYYRRRQRPDPGEAHP